MENETPSHVWPVTFAYETSTSAGATHASLRPTWGRRVVRAGDPPPQSSDAREVRRRLAWAERVVEKAALGIVVEDAGAEGELWRGLGSDWRRQ